MTAARRLLATLILVGGCSPKAAPVNFQDTPAPAPAADPPPRPVAPTAPPEPSWFDLGKDDRSYGSDLSGQLDRIDAELRSTAFLSTTNGLKSFFSDSKARLPDVRRLVADNGRAADPRIYLEIAVLAGRRAKEDGPVLYAMLTKNADRYAGRPWMIMGARVLELHENGHVTVGRIEMDPGRNPLLIGGRFTSPFVDGDRVDVVGYFAGTGTYENKAGGAVSLPAFAVAGMFKSGTIVAANRIVKNWLSDPPPNMLRTMPRKF